MDPGLMTSPSKGGLPHSLCAYGLLPHEDGVAVYVRRHLPLILVRTLGVPHTIIYAMNASNLIAAPL